MPRWSGRRITEYTASDRLRSVGTRVQRQEGRSITAPALARVRPRQWFGSENGIVADGTTNMAAALAALIGKMVPGDELVLEAGNIRSDSPIVLDRDMRLRGGATLTTGNLVAEQLRVIPGAKVTVEDLCIEGTGGTVYRGNTYGIKAWGVGVAEPVEGLTLKNVTFAEQGNACLDVRWGSHIVVKGCRFERFARSGGMFLSSEWTYVDENHVDTAVQPSGVANAYGFAFSRDHSQPLAVTPHATHFYCRDNEVRNIPGWEGIDTHAGQWGIVSGNRLYNCLQPIAIVSGHNEAEGTGGAYGPKWVTVENNYMESTVSDGTRRAGIVVQGAGNVVGSPVDPATGCRVVGNTVIGHGLQNTSNQGGIYAVRTDRLTVESNDLDQCSAVGIVIDNTNRTFVVADNKVRDTWSGNDVFRPPAVGVTSLNNVGYITGTSTSRGSKVAARVNERGIYVAASATNIIDLGKNPLREVVTRTVNIAE